MLSELKDFCSSLVLGVFQFIYFLLEEGYIGGNQSWNASHFNPHTKQTY